MSERSADWIAQAERDLEAARSQAHAGFHEWACFISQQAAEKAVKAVLQRWGAESWGHSVVKLLEALSERAKVGSSVQSAARTLDKYYVPARYPNGYAEGIPGDYITGEDAADATECADEIIRFCNGILAGPESGA